MASGSEMISASPSTWTHGPKKASVNTHSEASGLRRRFLVLTAVSRVLMITRPASSRPQVTGDSWGRPSARAVASTARWFARRKSRASSGCTGVALRLQG